MSQTSLTAPRLPLQILPWLFLLGGIAICPLAYYMFGGMGLFICGALAGFLVSMFTHPLLIFAIYFGALFFTDTTLGGALPISLNQVVAPLFFVSTLFYYLKGKANPPRFALLPLLAVVVAYFVVSGLTAEHFENGILYARYAVVYLLVAVCVGMVINSERKLYAAAWIILLSTFVAALHGFYEVMDKNLLGVVGNFWGSAKRATGTAPNSVVFGWNLVYGFPFAFFLFSQLRSQYTRLLALTMGLFILAVATFTFNRQTYVIMAIVVAVCALLFTYKNRAALLSLMALMGGIGAFTVLPLIVRRMLTVGDLTKDYSYLEREDSFLMGFQMFKAHPLTGVGFGSFSKVWGEYIPPDFSTYFIQYRGRTYEKFMDMGIFSIIAETGLVGLLVFVVLIVKLFFYISKRRREAVKAGDALVQNYASMLFVLLVFFLVSTFIQDTFLYTRMWVVYGLIFLLDPRHLPLAPASVSTADPALPVADTD